MHQYMLLLHSDPSTWERLSPEEMQKALEKFLAWGKKPYVKGGMRLAHDPGRVIRSQNGSPRTTDGPYSETKEVLGGYFVIEGADYNDAVQKSLDHPALEYGGTIELRQTFDS
jgi:hypothetical protein